MKDDYEIFERFCIQAEAIGDKRALKEIKKRYGDYGLSVVWQNLESERRKQGDLFDERF